METPVINSIEESPVKKRTNIPNVVKKITLLIVGILLVILNLSVLVKFSSISTKNEALSNLVIEQEKQISMLWVASFMSEGIVTDELVVQKAYFYRSGEGLSIDIRPQPSFADHFQGRGRFDISDRELKSVLLTLVDKLKEQFKEDPFLPDFDSLTIDISQNNYEVATYKDGSLKLKGE